MATFTLSEAISRIEHYGDKVAQHAKEYMSEYIRDNAKKGYATGTLAGSVAVERRDESTWAVGPADGEVGVHPYATYVDKGRGPVHAKNPSGRLHYQDPIHGNPENDYWMHPKSVKKMDGINFIEATKKHLEDVGVGL